MDESQFHRQADGTLDAIALALETADGDGSLDVELAGGVLTIVFPSGKQLVLSKHAPSRQLWLSSPLSGGLHFPWNGQSWQIADGAGLIEQLAQELRQMGGLTIDFSRP